MTIETYEITNHQEWLNLRMRDVTASRDIAAICGVHPTISPMHVYAEKKGHIERQADSNIMRRGRWMQPAIKEAWADEVPGITLTDCRHYYRDSELRIGATPDFLAMDETGALGVVDGKTIALPEFKRKWCEDYETDFEGDGGTISIVENIVPPIEIQIQLLVQAKLMRASFAKIGAFVVSSYGADLYPVDVLIDNAAAWDFVKTRVARFWEYFDAGEPPPVTPALDKEALAALYPTDAGPVLDLTGDTHVRYLLAEWQANKAVATELGERLKPTKARLAELGNEIKAVMGLSGLARAGDFEISCKLQHRKAIAATSFRVLRIKEKI